MQLAPLDDAQWCLVLASWDLFFFVAKVISGDHSTRTPEITPHGLPKAIRKCSPKVLLPQRGRPQMPQTSTVRQGTSVWCTSFDTLCGVFAVFLTCEADTTAGLLNQTKPNTIKIGLPYTMSL